MQEFKQETSWGSFIALDLQKVKIIHQNCFLWPSGSKTRLFTRMAACSGQTDANAELAKLLMLLCIPVFQITWYPYQEGSWGTQFKNPGLRAKVAHVRHNPLLTNLLQTQSPADLKQSAHPTALAHWKAFFLVYFWGWVLQLCCTSESALLPTPEGWWGLHTPQSWHRDPYTTRHHSRSPTSTASWERGSEERFGKLALHFRASRSETKYPNTHANYPLSFWNWFVPQDRRGSCSQAKAQANGCDKLQGFTSTEHCDHFQSPHLISTSKRWPVPVVMGESSWAQARGMLRCMGKLKGSFHGKGFASSHLAAAHFKVSFKSSS